MDFFTYENMKEFVVFSCFGAIVSLELYWISHAVIYGVKWAVKKLKQLFSKTGSKEDSVDE